MEENIPISIKRKILAIKMIVIPCHSYSDEANFSGTVEDSISTVRFFLSIALDTVTWTYNSS